jgi:predicted GIY-YIG superfamily endonuclease
VSTTKPTQKPKKKPPSKHPSKLQKKSTRPAGQWLVYLVQCRDGSLYTGITNDLPKRLKAHAAGKASRYTRSRLPVTLAYTEPQPSHSAALKREAAIKKLSREQKDRLIGGSKD